MEINKRKLETIEMNALRSTRTSKTERVRNEIIKEQIGR